MFSYLCYSFVVSEVIQFKELSIVHHLRCIIIQFIGRNRKVINHSDSFDRVDKHH